MCKQKSSNLDTVFSSWPKNVVDVWLRPFEQTQPWSMHSSFWESKFPDGYNKWQNVCWEKRIINFDEFELTGDYQYIIDEMKQNYVDSCDSSIEIENGLSRYNSAKTYLLKKYRFPHPPVLFQVDDAYGVADGSHRVLSWFQLMKEFSGDNAEIKKYSNQEFWIAQRRD